MSLLDFMSRQDTGTSSAPKSRKRWLDYNDDTLPAGTRQTKTTFKYIPGQKTKRSSISGLDTTQGYGTYQKVQTPYITKAEILDQLTNKMDNAPLTTKIDPKTGRTIATKSVAAPETPLEFAGTSGYDNVFASDDNKNITNTWILPTGAQIGGIPKTTNYNAPVSDAQRMSANTYGVSGVSNASVMRGLPNSYFDSSFFKTPGAQDGSALGSTVDYANRKAYSPQPNKASYLELGKIASNDINFGDLIPSVSTIGSNLPEYQEYKASGYTGSFTDWMRAGKPKKQTV